jgi:hypothetical protein
MAQKTNIFLMGLFLVNRFFRLCTNDFSVIFKVFLKGKVKTALSLCKHHSVKTYKKLNA